MPSEPTDIEALQRKIAELQAQLATAEGAASTGTQNITTGGGTVVQGPVEVHGGHFIGRDYLQFITHIVKSGEDPEEAKSVIAHYLGALAADLAGLKLGEIDTSVDQTKMSPLELADIYVPLDTTLRIPQDNTLAQWLTISPWPQGIYDLRKWRPVSALEALAEHRELTLLGKPGSGKSTFGASVLLALAQAWQGHSEELAKLGESWKHGALLPIRVILRRFAEQLPPGEQPASMRWPTLMTLRSSSSSAPGTPRWSGASGSRPPRRTKRGTTCWRRGSATTCCRWRRTPCC